MADEPKDGQQKPDSGDEAPKRRRPSTARKPAAKKPAEKPEAKAETPAKEKSPEPETKPARRRSSRPPRERRQPAEARVRPVVTARARYVRSSARKARLVLDHVRGKSVADARAVLRHSPRGVARDLERLLNSAIANAENNHDLVGDDLLVKEVFADEGPTLKRFRARAQGRAYRVRKRTSHLTMMLTPKE